MVRPFHTGVGALILAVCGSAAACDCDVPTLEPALRRSEAVFAGKVAAIEPEPGIRRRVTFTGVRWWKDGTAERLAITTPWNGGSCGYPFQTGTEYLVYARREKGETDLSTNLCTRTRPVDAAKVDLEALPALLVAMRAETKPETPRRVVLSRNARFLAVNTADGGVSVWDAVQARIAGEFPGAGRGGFTLSPDGALLLTESGHFREGKTIGWDVASGRQLWEQPSHGRSEFFFSADGAGLLQVTSLPTRNLRTVMESVDVKTGRSLKPFGAILNWATFALAPEGPLYAWLHRGKGEEAVVVSDLRTGEERSRLPISGSVFRLALAPSGRRLAVGGADGSISLWNVSTGARERALVEVPPGRPGSPPELSFSPDGRLLAAAPHPERTESNDPLRLWNAETGKPVVLPEAMGMRYPVFSADGSLVAALGAGGKLRVWNPHTGALVHTFDAPEPAARTRYRDAGAPPHAFSPDGRSLTAAGSTEAKRWSLPSARLEATLTFGPGR